MPFLTDLNKQPVVLIILLGILVSLLVKGGVRGRTAVLLLLVTIIISDQLNSSILKHVFLRVRPCHVLSDVHLLVSCGSGYSFPSSHAVNNFAGATILSSLYRKWQWMFFTFAGLVVFSRISVGVHYPSDIIGGAIVGIAVGLIVLMVYRLLLDLWKNRQLSRERNDDSSSRN